MKYTLQLEMLIFSELFLFWTMRSTVFICNCLPTFHYLQMQVQPLTLWSGERTIMKTFHIGRQAYKRSFGETFYCYGRAGLRMHLLNNNRVKKSFTRMQNRSHKATNQLFKNRKQSCKFPRMNLVLLLFVAFFWWNKGRVLFHSLDRRACQLVIWWWLCEQQEGIWVKNSLLSGKVKVRVDNIC